MCSKAKIKLLLPLPWIKKSFQAFSLDSICDLPNVNKLFKQPKEGKLDSLFVAFWPSTWPKMPFRVMHWKEVTHSNGSYERKSHGWKLADEIGHAKKHSHGTLIDWCTGREWPVNCMTVISAWSRSNMRFQRLSGRSSGRWTII